MGAFLPRQCCGLRWLEAEIQTDPLPPPKPLDDRMCLFYVCSGFLNGADDDAAGLFGWDSGPRRRRFDR